MFWKKKNNIDLSWIDEYISNVRPYVFVRTEDNILIKRPNQATKINSTGASILKFLLNGGMVEQLIRKTGKDKAVDIEIFMLAVKGFVDGSLDEFTLNPAVDIKQFKLGFSDFPILSEFAITYKCNISCKFCYAGCNCTSNPIESNDELTTEQCLQLIETIYYKGKVPSISFTGGEPTLRKDTLLNCIRHAKELGMRINLITNGTLINREYAGDLINAGLDSVQVSIEGTNSETHDLVVGMKGSFTKSINTVKLFKSLGIHVHTNTTLNRLNLEDSFQLPMFVKELGLDRFSMNLIIPTGSSVINKELVIPYSEVGEYIERINTLSKESEVEFMWYSPVPMCMFNTITEGLGNKGCAACDGLLSLAPNGDVLPCASYDKSVGNLVMQPFSEVWNSAESKHFRDKKFAHDICKKCDNFALCNGGCPLYWRNKGYDELIAITKPTII